MSSTKTSDIKSAVIDNNILIDLNELGKLYLLFKIFDVVYIPKVIYDKKIMEEIISEIEREEFQLASIRTEVGYNLYSELLGNERYKNLSHYDKEAIAIDKQELVFCSSNDGLVRKACAEYKVECLGILGVLKRAYTKEVIDKKELVKLSRGLLETSCYITKKVIEEFIKEL